MKLLYCYKIDYFALYTKNSVNITGNLNWKTKCYPIILLLLYTLDMPVKWDKTIQISEINVFLTALVVERCRGGIL